MSSAKRQLGHDAPAKKARSDSVPYANDALIADVLYLIFRYLPWRARLLTLALVCKTWRRAAITTTRKLNISKAPVDLPLFTALSHLKLRLSDLQDFCLPLSLQSLEVESHSAISFLPPYPRLTHLAVRNQPLITVGMPFLKGVADTLLSLEVALPFHDAPSEPLASLRMPALRSLTIRAIYGRSNDAALADFLAFVSVHLMQLTRLAVHSAFCAPSAVAVLTHLNACETLPALRELVLPENEGTLPLLRHSMLRAESLALQWHRSLGDLPPAALTCLTELNGAVEWLHENAPILASLARFKKLEVTQTTRMTTSPCPWDALEEDLPAFPSLLTCVSALLFVSNDGITLEPWQPLRLCSNITELVLSPYTQLEAQAMPLRLPHLRVLEIWWTQAAVMDHSFDLATNNAVQVARTIVAAAPHLRTIVFITPADFAAEDIAHFRELINWLRVTPNRVHKVQLDVTDNDFKSESLQPLTVSGGWLRVAY